MSLTVWAFELAEAKLAAVLPRRWTHVRGVARQARTLLPIAGSDADLLEAAAILHDIGYAPDLVDTGFHPIDGATYLAKIGAPERLVRLVAHHSYAQLEAELRGLGGEMADFLDERPDPDGRLFTGPRGGRITTALLRDATHWDEVVATLGYEHLRRHDLRHTGLTWMADAGVPVHHLRKRDP